MVGTRRLIIPLLLLAVALTGCKLDLLKEVKYLHEQAITVAAPVFSVSEGTYNNNFTITMTSETSGALIHYTVEDSTPTALYGMDYSGSPIGITEADADSGVVTIKAVAYTPGDLHTSAVTTARYTLKTDAPSLTPDGGTWSAGSIVTVTVDSVTTGASLRYALDDAALSPSDGTVVADGASVALTASHRLKVIAYRTGYQISEIAFGDYTIGSVLTPIISPSGGTFDNDVPVTITCGTDGATIYYTDDGSDPTTSGTKTTYAGPFTVATTATQIRAYALKTGLSDSGIISETYTLQAATPTFNPAAGTHADGANVTIISSTSGCTIRYTTSGSIPDPGTGTIYTSPVSIATTKTLQAMAYKSGYLDSAVQSGTYTITYTLTVTKVGNGTTTPATSATLEYNVPYSISATPATGSHFDNWTATSGSGVIFGDANAASTTVTLTSGSATIRATFELNTYTLTIANDGHGTTTPAATATVTHGVPFNISASPAAGYGFSSWTLTLPAGAATFADSYAATTTVACTNNVTIQANFSNIVYVSTSGSTSYSGFHPSRPKSTIADGISAAAARSATEVRVAQGTYSEGVTLVHGVSLYGGYNSSFGLRNPDSYVSKINGTTGGTIVVASDAAISNSDVLDGFTIESNANNAMIGISLTGAASPTIQNNKINIAYSIANTSCPYGMNIEPGGLGTCTAKVINNKIWVYRTNVTSTTFALRAVTLRNVAAGSSVTLDRNTITAWGSANRSAGIRFDKIYGEVIIKNNIVSVHGASTEALYLYDIYSGANLRIANNTIVANGTGSVYGLWKAGGTQSGNWYVVNNIMCSPGPIGYGIYWISGTGETVTVKFNLLFGFATRCYNYTLDTTNSQDVGDPFAPFVFVGFYDSDFSDGHSTDYHLADTSNIYAVDKGTDTNNSTYGFVSVDIDGQSRPRGTYFDRGADEK